MHRRGEIVSTKDVRELVREDRVDLLASRCPAMLRGHNSTGLEIPNTPGSSDVSDETSAIGRVTPPIVSRGRSASSSRPSATADAARTAAATRRQRASQIVPMATSPHNQIGRRTIETAWFVTARVGAERVPPPDPPRSAAAIENGSMIAVSRGWTIDAERHPSGPPMATSARKRC